MLTAARASGKRQLQGWPLKDNEKIHRDLRKGLPSKGNSLNKVRDRDVCR